MTCQGHAARKVKFEARSPHFRLSAADTLKAGSYKLITNNQNPGTRQRRRKGEMEVRQPPDQSVPPG